MVSGELGQEEEIGERKNEESRSSLFCFEISRSIGQILIIALFRMKVPEKINLNFDNLTRCDKV